MRRNNMLSFVIIFFLLMTINVGFTRLLSYDYWYGMLLQVPGLIIAITCHEFAHAFVSHRLGDPTPNRQDRLTLNPMAHVDLFGMLALIFAGFGWGKAVRVDPSYYKNRRMGQFLVGIAGVSTNLIIALSLSLLMRGLFEYALVFMLSGIGEVVTTIIIFTIQINLVLMIFNLLPVPPLDGFGIVTQIFRLDRYSWHRTVYQNGFIILLALIIFDVPSMIISPVMYNMMDVMYSIMGV